MKSLTLVRRIAARPAIVFEALTTADGVAAWWGPDDLPVVRAEMDARVGVPIGCASEPSTAGSTRRAVSTSSCSRRDAW
jgi:uncharacterized protein YndB with AHSA1/START domain